MGFSIDFSLKKRDVYLSFLTILEAALGSRLNLGECNYNLFGEIQLY